MVSGSFSLLCSRFFSPFLHSTGSLSVSREYLALRDGPRRIRDFHPLRYIFPDISTSFCLDTVAVLLPRQCRNIAGLGSSAFARHYLRNHCYFLFLWVLRCFSSPRSLTLSKVCRRLADGLPHSDIRGSRDICSSPRLFAAYHVLLRLREPRHPPFALAYFLLPSVLYSIPKVQNQGMRYTLLLLVVLFFLWSFQYVK